MKHEDYIEMLAFAALDALDEGERRTLDVHLAECGDCRAELNALRNAAASLVYAASPVVPAAPELRARILASIKSQAQDVSREPSNGAATSPVSSTTSNVRSLEEFAKRRGVIVSRRMLIFSSLAASIAVAALLISLALLWQRNTRLQGELARLSDTVNQSGRQLSQTEQELARTRADRELLTAPDAQTATLAGTKIAERAHARLTFDERTGRALLVAADLPPAPAGFAYQLWFIAEGRPPIPGNVFTTDGSGHAELHDTIPPAGRLAAVVYAVTLEPASGVSAPTGEIYLKSSAS
ncbi:MAG: anti-sigma factor [Acidobacteria bacterium]|nr:anti-sigma factor [Acidobacteriota bacterium]